MEENFCREVRNFKVTGNWREASLGLLALISRGMRQLMGCPLPKILHFKSNEENVERGQSAPFLELRVSSERGKRGIYYDVAIQKEKRKLLVLPGT